MNERMDVRYGPYRLVAASYKGDFQAVAYLGRQETLRVSGQSLVEAMADLQVRIEANRAAMLAARGDGEPSPEEYRTALEGYRRLVSPDALTMLHQHASLPDHRSTISELARSCRLDADAAHKACTQLARLVGDALTFRPVDKSVSRDRALLSLCTIDPGEHDNQWVLRRGVVAALNAPLQIQ